MNIGIIHYNTPKLTDCLVKSILKTTPNSHIYIFENSDKEPFINTYDNITIFDNTRQQMLNFDEVLNSKKDSHHGVVNNYASFKHCYSVQKLIELIDEPFVLLDSDVLVLKDLNEICNENYIYVSGIAIDHYNDTNKERVAPYCCYINTNMCKKYGIKYYDENRMLGLNNYNGKCRYDTGTSFYEDCLNIPHKIIKFTDYVLHFVGGSWKNKDKNIFLNEHWDLWDGIDIVVPYVNNQDPIWQKEYENYKNIREGEYGVNTLSRYRDWGTLRYWFRGVETYAPWINKIFLILSGPTQIPYWLNIDNPKLRIVYHKDYIPERFLPTFNSNTIECFLWRIPELSEHFIYSNDDVFICKPLSPDDFFNKDKVAVNLNFKKGVNEYYKKAWRNCIKFGYINHPEKYDDNTYVRTDHGLTPMRKSSMKYLFDYYGEELLQTFTHIRDEKNVAQYLFPVYEDDLGNRLDSKIKNYHGLKIKSPYQYPSKINEYDTFCIIDDKDVDYPLYRDNLITFMKNYYPKTSSFENKTIADSLKCKETKKKQCDRIIRIPTSNGFILKKI